MISRAQAGACVCKERGGSSEVSRAESRGLVLVMHGGARPTVMIQRKEIVASLLLAPW